MLQNISFDLGFGHFVFPRVQQGKVDSCNLLGLFELLLFKWYAAFEDNHDDYVVGIDIGSNIGFHSAVMAKYFKKVIAYDPETNHEEAFRRTIGLSQEFSEVILNHKAVSDYNGIVDFTRVKDNTTASYIGDFKEGYGELESLTVPVVKASSILFPKSVVKIDAEGAETSILSDIPVDTWKTGIVAFFELPQFKVVSLSTVI